MKTMKVISGWTSIFALLVSSCFVSPNAFATSRTVYFNSVGTNRTVEGLSAPATSTCTLVITNPSSTGQNFSMTTSVSAINSWMGASTDSGTFISETASGTAVTGSCSISACTGQLPNRGDSITIKYAYRAVPARPAGTVSYVVKQSLRCTGSIQVTDAAQPGFVVASGTLVTFVESAKMHTDAATSGTSTFGGLAVYSQIPIAINRGKPF